MDILINNPISLMYGPYFLAFYAGIIATVGTAANWLIKGSSKTTAAIPTHPDPSEIAYLRGGETAVIKLACFSLLQRGLVKADKHHLENIVDDGVDLSNLSAIEQAVYDYLATPRTVTAMKSNFALKSKIAFYCQDYKKSLIKQGYLTSATKKYLFGGAGAFIVLSLGSYKMISALSRGHHNVLFLLIMAIAATFWLGIISCPLYNRLTAKGKKYLANLQNTFANLPSQLKSPPTEPDYNTSLLVALKDLESIKETTIETYQSAIALFTAKKISRSRISNSSSSSGCSSFSCGSSCGSSCGGCGGCGG